MSAPRPPRLLQRLLERVAGPGATGVAAVGDLEEGYRERAAGSGRLGANVWYLRQIFSLAAHGGAGRGSRAGPGERFLHFLGGAVRALVRRPAFGLLVTVVLAVAIGATSAAWSVARGTLDATRAWEHPGRTVLVWPEEPFSRGQLEVLRTESAAFEAVGGILAGPAVLAVGGDRAESAAAVALSPELFAALRARPVLGRGIVPADADPFAEPVAVIGHALWTRAFAADPAVVGSVVEISGVRRRVVGVMPPGAEHPGVGTEVWTPLVLDPFDDGFWPARELELAAVVSPGLTLDDARDDVRRVFGALAQRFPGFFPPGWGSDATVDASEERTWRAVALPLLLLLGGSGVLLLVAGIDVGNLVLARSLERREEFRVRAALGASRGQVVREIGAEAGLRALLAGGVGWLLGASLAARLPELFPASVGVAAAPAGGGAVLLFVAGTAGVAWLLMAGVPAVHFLRTTRRSVTPTRAGGGPPRGLVVAQAGLATVLLITSGLLLRTIRSLEDVPLGFEPEGATMVRVTPRSDARSAGDIDRLRTAVSEALTASPSVRAAGWISAVPLLDPVPTQPVNPEDDPVQVAEAIRALAVVADGGAFDALGLRVVEGRGLGRDGEADATPVVVVNETLARALWPEGNAVGRRVAIDPHAWNRWVTVVGVVDDVRHRSLTLPPAPAFYQPRDQASAPALSVVASAPGGAGAVSAAVRGALEAVAPDVPVGEGRALETVVRDAQGAARVLSALLGVLAALATVLGALGLYGSLAGWVARRRRELGTRLALGASPSELWLGVIGTGVLLTAGGVLLGALGSVVVARGIRGLLYGVSPLDPVAFGAPAVILLAAGLVAAALPALRAASVPPARALQGE